MSESVIIRIPVSLTPRQREAVGKDVIREIRSRTKSGISKFGTLFPAYSSSYDREGTPDLSRTGEMLSDLSLLNHGRGFIKIGFRDPQSDDKAKFNRQNRRQFLGISRKDLNRIVEIHK